MRLVVRIHSFNSVSAAGSCDELVCLWQMGEYWICVQKIWVWEQALTLTVKVDIPFILQPIFPSLLPLITWEMILKVFYKSNILYKVKQHAIIVIPDIQTMKEGRCFIYRPFSRKTCRLRLWGGWQEKANKQKNWIKDDQSSYKLLSSRGDLQNPVRTFRFYLLCLK